MKVFVYFNLRKRMWSIRAMEGPNKGKVIDHRETVYLSNVFPKVSEAGRQRVMRERRKNVHAGLTGTLEESQQGPIDGNWWTVRYNPYHGGYFYATIGDSKWALTCADHATLIAYPNHGPDVYVRNGFYTDPLG